MTEKAPVSSPKSLVRKTRSLSEIYQTYNLIIIETESYEKASKEEVWRNAMEEEMRMEQ